MLLEVAGQRCQVTVEAVRSPACAAAAVASGELLGIACLSHASGSGPGFLSSSS